MTPYFLWQQATLALLLLSLLVSGRAAAPSEPSEALFGGAPADQKGTTNGHPNERLVVGSGHRFLSAEEHLAATKYFQQEFNSNRRGLQVDTESFTPEGVCQSFASLPDFNQTYACSCENYGDNKIQVDCDFRAEQCNDDGSLCYVGSIQRILEVDPDAVVDEKNQVQLPEIAVTSCTRFTTVEDDDSETCIRIFPVKNGDFTELKTCSVQYTPIAGEEPRVCSDCSICETDDDSDLPQISFNCCNLETDLKQTCGPTSGGVAVPIFDVIPESEKGICTGSGATAALGRGSFSLFGAISFATTALYLVAF